MKKRMVAAALTLIGAAAGVISIFRKMREDQKKEIVLNRKNEMIIQLYYKWLELNLDGKSVADYLMKKGYYNIAIYGMHYLGESLNYELSKSDIKVRYAIDKNAEKISGDLEIYRPDDKLEEVEAVIVTAFYFYEDIKGQLTKQLRCPILSIEDILFQM